MQDSRIETRPLTAADVDSAATVLGLAFADYPWTRWTVAADNHVARITELQRLCLQHLGLPFGRVWVTTVDETVHSVAFWADTAQRAPAELVADLSPRFAELEGDRHLASAAADAEVHGWRPEQRHLYLGTTGTTPAVQQRGLATRTLAPGLAFADAENITACLETSTYANVELYSRLGFSMVHHWRIAQGAGPDVWTMQRAPRPLPGS